MVPNEMTYSSAASEQAGDKESAEKTTGVSPIVNKAIALLSEWANVVRIPLART